MHPITVVVGILLFLAWMGKSFVIGLLVIFGIGVVATIIVSTLGQKSTSQYKSRPSRSQLNAPATYAHEIGRSYAPPSQWQSQQSSTPKMNAPISGLIIRPEPLEKILDGRKMWEMRSDGKAKREIVALIEKGGKRILGVARIVDVRGPLSEQTMRDTFSMHGIDSSRLLDPSVQKLRFAWVLADIKRFDSPVPFEPRSGPVRFVTLNDSERAAIQRHLSEA